MEARSASTSLCMVRWYAAVHNAIGISIPYQCDESMHISHVENSMVMTSTQAGVAGAALLRAC
jgi:hypothetical protein